MGKKLRLLCAADDRAALQPVLDALKAKGVSAADANGRPDGKAVLLAVLSERFYADETLKNALLGALGAGAENVLPLRLDAYELPPEIKTALYARNIIPASERSAEQTAERIAAALPEKKRRTGAALIALAALLAVLAGVLIWRSLPREETPEPVPAAAADIAIPEGIGLRAEDLQNIRSAVIIGDEYYFLDNSGGADGGIYGNAPSVNNYAVRGNGQWFSKKDGHAFSLTRYDDLRFLALMPNLKIISFALVDVGELPDMSDISLRRIELEDCTIDRLDWFGADKLEIAYLHNCPILDYSPLNASAYPLQAEIAFIEGLRPDLSGFRPQSLSSLSMSGNPASIQMPELRGQSALREISLYGLPIEDLDFLEGCTVRELELSDCDRLRDVSALGGMSTLNVLRIVNSPLLVDCSPIGGCGALRELCLDSRGQSIRDVSFLAGLNDLSSITLYDCNIPNLDFLHRFVGKPTGLTFCFSGSCGDWSGLETVGKFERLELDLRNSSYDAIAPYIEKALLDSLSLGEVRDLELSRLPRNVMNLQLRKCGFGQDLSALAGRTLGSVSLSNISALTSLNGLQELNFFGEMAEGDLWIDNCPRLTDWSALEGLSINRLSLRGVYTLPDFGSFRFQRLRLDSLDWLEDLSCLNALDESYTGYTEFSLPGMDRIRDLSPIARVLHSGRLEIPPQLEEQARELQQQGKISWYSVVFPEGGWEPDNSALSLLSLDELNTLPGALLRRVTTLAVAGDTVYDPDRFDVEERWEDNQSRRVLRERATGEETEVRGGAVTDIGMFSALTGLRELYLTDQPLSTLDGIQNLEKLEELRLNFCANLRDVSPAFSMQGIRSLELRGTPVQSIRGVQNLYGLSWLQLDDTQVTDLSPLLDCDFSEAERNGGFGISLNNCRCGDCSPLSAVPHYKNLSVYNVDVSLWLDAVRGSRIEMLYAGGNTGLDNGMFRRLVREHPELRRLNICWNNELTDLTPVLELPSLERLELSRNMNEAIDSIKGKELPFELDIQG